MHDKKYKPRENTNEIIYSAALDLHQNNQVVTREALQKATGQTKTVIDDRLKVLTDDGLMRRVERGVYIPIFKHHAARVISKTILPDGSIRLDIGDDVLDLTPHEAMILGRNLMGEAMSLSAIEMGNQFGIQNEQLKNEITKLKQQIRHLEHQHKQPDLLNETAT
ncbi:hypothetical protein [Wielerella bovis]|uniref:hypothetical protein n=1 Tax=Wielerella bovis TaxID=2917790 RepID=UPI0020191DED|nr:hypothetical protein [Wielerella bovis]ULJ66669.1 hypothetical protein MIS31_10540 [Wielerella bovis]